ncbi:diacylglycerol O-acyltransferase 3, cytosolic [Vigna radiata var. radiata]|uniref:Diacylglycerol O-acyltransferase 3, cytosolic n=1 Tax=Vigna radiata var. radiata TaxID=3916 RepID=A0A1S3UHV1_VIGRR|nr:diacylglycerol O-acyltransferase 3, cytosolic [Vigna radiata var. radiata]
MEISGTVFRHVSYVSGAGTHTRSRGVAPRVAVRMGTGSDFCDEGHLQYYQNTKKVLSPKKKLKLLKDFSKLGFASDPQKLSMFYDLQQNLTSDAGDVLLRELEAARAKEKEMKKKRKQEKKAKLKASKKKCESSSSSSESSDSDCGCDQVVDMNSFRSGIGVSVVAPAAPVDESPIPKTTPIVEDGNSRRDAMELCSNNDLSVSSVRDGGIKRESAVVTTSSEKRIEVCMGGKCKRSGAAALLQEFQKVVGVEGGAVVACKCMGKCKTAPNVRVQNSVDHSLAQGLDDSVKFPANPLCIGVGLEDVDAIVARFLGENPTDIGMAGAITAT